MLDFFICQNQKSCYSPCGINITHKKEKRKKGKTHNTSLYEFRNRFFEVEVLLRDGDPGITIRSFDLVIGDRGS